MNTPDYSNYNARSTDDYEKIWTSTGKCVFCDLKEKYIIAEHKNVVLTVNLFPYIDGHLVVIPRRHFEKFSEIKSSEWAAIEKLAKIGNKLLEKVLKMKETWLIFRTPDAFKAAKSVRHAHIHIIPYFKGLDISSYQEIKIPPVELAEKLRAGLE